MSDFDQKNGSHGQLRKIIFKNTPLFLLFESDFQQFWICFWTQNYNKTQ